MNKNKAYLLLGVDSNSTKAEIKRAYRALSSKHHPDKHINSKPDVQDLNEKLFKRCKSAYEYLSDPKSRERLIHQAYNPYRQDVPSNAIREFNVSIRQLLQGLNLHCSFLLPVVCGRCDGSGLIPSMSSYYQFPSCPDCYARGVVDRPFSQKVGVPPIASTIRNLSAILPIDNFDNSGLTVLINFKLVSDDYYSISNDRVIINAEIIPHDWISGGSVEVYTPLKTIRVKYGPMCSLDVLHRILCPEYGDIYVSLSLVPLGSSDLEIIADAGSRYQEACELALAGRNPTYFERKTSRMSTLSTKTTR